MGHRPRRSAIAPLATLVWAIGACGSPPASSISPFPAVASPSSAVVSSSPGMTATPTPAVPTPAGVPPILDGEAWLALQTRTAAGYGVHLIRPDGTGLHRWPAPVPGTHEHPDWSPDGVRILLNTVTPDGTEDLWVADADGSDAELLLDCVAPCVWLDEAAWSPDGARIAVQRLVSGDGGPISTLELLDVATRATTIVLTMPDGEVVLAPRWSPDGRRLVVEAIHLQGGLVDAGPDAGWIGVVDLDAPDPVVEPITERDFSNSPDWSADGSLVVWSRPEPDGGSDVWVAGPDGTDPHRVTDLAATGGGADQPAFTPDGRSIVFVWSEPAKAGRIGRIDPDGSNLGSAIGTQSLDAMHPRLRPAS